MIIVNIIQMILIAVWNLFTVYIVGGLTSKKNAFNFTINVWAPVISFILLTKVCVRGKEYVKPEKNYIFMANHSSYFDIAVLFMATQRKIHFMAKDELRTNPFTGFMLKKIEMIFIDRSNAYKSKESLQRASEFIKQGRDLMVFPEGTRTKTDKIGPFKRGGFKIAVDSHVPIVPIIIQKSAKAWPRNNFNFRPTTVTVKFCEPIETTNFTEKNMSALLSSVKTIMEQKID
ncbi:MAG: lysophospholipid acyltransferase family protein [Bacteroidales bacterium]|jgi:1-acyl-sn-glycerol-3-phosphate acyltransferase|nr:lysophospholipid acyltransferase family protein [Bacteroidales bacterium]